MTMQVTDDKTRRAEYVKRALARKRTGRSVLSSVTRPPP
jgi:hypothetical protein